MDKRQIVHKRTGRFYTLVSLASQLKEGNKWVSCVIYTDDNGATYVRKTQDFRDHFQNFKP